MADDALLDLASIDPDAIPAFGNDAEDGEQDHGSPFEPVAEKAPPAKKAPAKKKSAAKKKAAAPKPEEGEA